MDADTMSPESIQARLDEMQKELIRKANSKQNYDAIADEIFTLREQKSQSEADTGSREETRKRVAELQDFIGSQQSEAIRNHRIRRKPRSKANPADHHSRLPLHRGIEVRHHNRHQSIKRLLAADTFAGSEEPWSVFFLIVLVP